MDDKTTPSIQLPVGITAEQMQAIMNRILGTAGDKQPAPPGPAALPIPGQLAETTEPAQAGERIGNAMADMMASVPLTIESGWKSRKLWVAMGTLAGMLAQLPLDKVLPVATQAIFGVVAIVYIIIQGLVDIAKARGNGKGSAA